MTINMLNKITVEDACLLVNGKVILTGVPQNVVVSPGSFGSAFVGASSTAPSYRHVFSLGVLQLVLLLMTHFLFLF